MVRLRAERWFSANGQRRSRHVVGAQNSGAHRLISLCFLLALVILLIQQASDPRHVSSAFRSLGVPLEASPTAAPEPSQRIPESGGKWAISCSDLVPRMLAEATERQINLLSSAWFGVSNSERNGADATSGGLEELKNSSLSILDALAAELKANEQGWSDQLSRFRTEWLQWWQFIDAVSNPQFTEPRIDEVRTGFADKNSVGSPELRHAIAACLDRRLIGALDDAAPWSSRESTAFWRLIQRGRSPPGDHFDQPEMAAPLISTLQLESEAKDFKGKLIRFRGSVRRIEFVQRSNSGAGIVGYWLAWLRGVDGSAQPVAVYATAGGFHDIELALSRHADEFPEVEVDAIVGKRLAYASQAGVQVAPTLFTTGLRVLTLPAASTMPNTPTNWTRDLALSLLGGALLACLVCLAIFGNWRKSPPKRRAATKTTSCILMVVALAGRCGTLASAQDQTPPWAKAANGKETLRSVLGERLQSTLTANAITKLLSYLEKRASEAETLKPVSGEFPNETLQVMHTLNQLGWQRSLDCGILFSTAEGEYQLRAVFISGLATAVVPADLTPAQKAWFQRRDDDQLFQLAIEPRDSQTINTAQNVAENMRIGKDGRNALPVLCQQIPQIWRTAPLLRQPTQVMGFGVYQGASDRPVCVLADAADWVLRNADWSSYAPPVPENFAVLGKLEWNLRFADLVTSHNQQPLRDSEAEAFYSMLRVLDAPAAVASVKAHVGDRGPLDILAEPQKSLGQSIRWPVRLVSCSVVQVEADMDRQALGTNRYFQFDGFVDMGSERVRYQISADPPTKDLLFEREFPVTVVMRGTSEFTPRSALEAGIQSWDVGKFVKVEGCFYRLWSFESELLQRNHSGARQAAPLIIASQLRLSSPPISPAYGREIGWFGYALCLATLVILVAILFSAATSGRSAKRI